MITVIDNVTINGCEYSQVPVQVLGDLGATEEQIALIVSEAEAAEAAEAAKKKARAFLGSTDWKMLRHADEVAMGITPSLSEEEYSALLVARKEARSNA